MWALGSLFGAIGGCFGFSVIRIAQVEDSLRTEMRREFEDMRAENQGNVAAATRVNEAIWTEMRRMSAQSEDHRSRIQDRIAQLPTREETKADLAAMERRIEKMIQAPGPRH